MRVSFQDSDGLVGKEHGGEALCSCLENRLPSKSSLRNFRLPADKLPCPRLIKSSRAPNRGARELPVRQRTVIILDAL
jgi:hypothetical protein